MKGSEAWILHLFLAALSKAIDNQGEGYWVLEQLEIVIWKAGGSEVIAEATDGELKLAKNVLFF